MKKTITLVVAAMLAVTCQKENASVENGASSSGKLTATIVQTKVTYTESAELNLQPAWEVGDKIIGFDDAGNTYTLTVASVSAETATLSGRVPDGALHLIYKSGAKASDISAKTLAIDYKNQAGDKTMPAVMLCATDQLLGTGFQSGWDGHTQRRARRFTYLFLTESNRCLRYFEKFAFLPLKPSEILRIWCGKARSLFSSGKSTVNSHTE